MGSRSSHSGPNNAETRVGRGKVRMAHYGKDQFGLKMSMKNRTKLLTSGAEDLVEGMKKDKKKSKGKIKTYKGRKKG